MYKENYVGCFQPSFRLERWISGIVLDRDSHTAMICFLLGTVHFSALIILFDEQHFVAERQGKAPGETRENRR